MRSFLSCGVRIDALTIDDAVARLVSGEARGAIHLCNAYTLSLASRDERIASVLDGGRLNLPDGMPLVWIARWLGLRHMTGRVFGAELMELSMVAGSSRGVRHFLYGSTPEVIRALEVALTRRCPGAVIVGSEAPPFGDFDGPTLDAATKRFVDAGADVVWVGLGTPKQDVVTAAFAERSDLTFVAVGAAFDFIAGTKPMAPRAMRDHGWEWLFRLLTEPRRLWRRYLIGNTVFVTTNLRSRPRLVSNDQHRSTSDTS
jgi:N-acetylglucosaminyldiphosphoundecaprenol N-acetyl-beta-D-mannosaminyltransferase